MANRHEHPSTWQADIDRSVTEYDGWYLAEAPRMFAEARSRAIVEVEEAMRVACDFRTLDAEALIAWPGTLFVARMCISPPMARDRFISFSGVSKSLVTSMEREGAIPSRTRR